MINEPQTLESYGIMIEELLIREIRIDRTTGPGDSDSWMTSFKVIMPPLKTQINYENPIVRYVALSRLVIRKNK